MPRCRQLASLTVLAGATSWRERLRLACVHRPVCVIAAVALSACVSGTAERFPAAGGDGSALEAFLRPTLASRTEPVWRHVLRGEVYYIAQASCCDRRVNLFDARGNFICAPFGGFAGGGDGKCPTALRRALMRSKGLEVPNPFLTP